MEEKEERKGRPIIDEIGENVFSTIKTPADILFMTLFVLGVLSIASTTLVGECGDVDDRLDYGQPRISEYTEGAIVVFTIASQIEEDIVGSGICGIIEKVDGEGGTARVHVLAKSTPFFVDESPYRPRLAFSGFSEAPLSTFLFLHSGNPVGDVPVTNIAPIETKPYTNFIRDFYLNTIYIVMLILAIIIILLGYTGYRYEKMRIVWYERHTLRATYISRLMQERGKTRELQDKWYELDSIFKKEEVRNWKEMLSTLDEILEGVLELTYFEGENVTEKLKDMTEKDIWTHEKLSLANSVIVSATGKSNETKDFALTKKRVEKVFNIYKESLIWLGLLPHHIK